MKRTSLLALAAATVLSPAALAGGGGLGGGGLCGGGLGGGGLCGGANVIPGTTVDVEFAGCGPCGPTAVALAGCDAGCGGFAAPACAAPAGVCGPSAGPGGCGVAAGPELFAPAYAAPVCAAPICEPLCAAPVYVAPAPVCQPVCAAPAYGGGCGGGCNTGYYDYTRRPGCGGGGIGGLFGKLWDLEKRKNRFLLNTAKKCLVPDCTPIYAPVCQPCAPACAAPAYAAPACAAPVYTGGYAAPAAGCGCGG